jgi:uncharacterized protein YkwD
MILLIKLIGWIFSKLFSGLSPLRERKGSRQLRIINRIRIKHGLKPFKAYYELDSIAKGHSQYMAKRHVCNHDGFKSKAMAATHYTGR